MDDRRRLVDGWARGLVSACESGQLTGKSLALRRVRAISGPRAAVLDAYPANLEADKLIQALTRSRGALLHQLVPWRFVGMPIAYMSGGAVRLEAGWPEELAQSDIPVARISSKPEGRGRWVCGVTETGSTLVMGVGNQVPHVLIAGQTGSGKTYAMRSAVAQFARDAENHLVLVDGKYGDGLGIFEGVRGLVGPVAVGRDEARLALAWASTELRRRYEARRAGVQPSGRVIIVVDELQDFLRDGDPDLIALIRGLVERGRGAGVHVVLSTQHPVQSVFGDPSIRRNLTGRIVLKTEDEVATRVAVGDDWPPAHRLLKRGDSFVIAPGVCHRTQIAYVTEDEIRALPLGGPEFAEWPMLDAAGALSNQVDDAEFNPLELAVSLAHAREGGGRPSLKTKLVELGQKSRGSLALERLLEVGREQRRELGNLGWVLERTDGNGRQTSQ